MSDRKCDHGRTDCPACRLLVSQFREELQKANADRYREGIALDRQKIRCRELVAECDRLREDALAAQKATSEAEKRLKTAEADGARKERERARQEVMGALLATADMAVEMSPPRGTTARDALWRFSEILMRLGARDYAGWADFVATVRRQGAANATPTEGARNFAGERVALLERLYGAVLDGGFHDVPPLDGICQEFTDLYNAEHHPDYNPTEDGTDG